MSDQLNILPGVAFLGVNPINAGIGRDVTPSFGKGERDSADGAKAVLFLQERGQELGIDVVGNLKLPGTLFSAAGNVAEMVIDAAGVVTNLLVLRASLPKARPAFGTQAPALRSVEVLRVGRVELATVAAWPQTVMILQPHLLISGKEVSRDCLIVCRGLPGRGLSWKYFAIVPALFAATLPWLGAIDFMRLTSPTSAIMSAVIFNAIIIPLLIPIALKGVKYRPVGADALLRRNLLVWGLGGVIAPFFGIKLIDMLLALLGLA